MKTKLLIITTLALFPLISNISALCAADSLEWWEPCNDAGQTDILSFKAIMIIIILSIIGIIIFFVVKKWKRK